MEAFGGELPAGFESLEPFVGEWAHLATQDQRYLQRQRLPMDRLQAFYDAASPRLDEIFQHLERFPFGEELPPGEAQLFRLIMGMTEVAQAVETYGQPTVPHTPPNHSVTIQGMFDA